MQIIKEIRKQRRLSQRTMARMSGLSFRCVQQVESSDHNWRVSSVRDVAKAFGLPKSGLDYYLGRYFSITADSVEDISLRIWQDGFKSWRIHLFNFVDRMRVSRNSALIRAGPIVDLDPRLRALIASTVEALCQELGMSPPPWCRGILPLTEPWFVSGVENLKAMALTESPTSFRARNIFVLNDFLSRA